MQLVVDNLLTNYSTLGSGPVLLLLHGWGDDLRTFTALQDKLVTSYKVIAVDLPGFGQTQMPSVAWNLDNYADFTKKFLSKVGADKPYAIIGHSNGGALAIRGLASGTLEADKLILLAASGVRNGQSVKRLVFKVIAKVGKVATFWLPMSAKQKLRKRLYGVAGSDMLVAPHLQETFKTTVRQDIQEDAKKLKQPVLLIYAEKDAAVPPADGKKLAQLIPNARFVEVGGADHFVHHSVPQEVLKLVQEFLAA